MDKDQVLHLHEFFVEGNNPEESHVLLNITEPSTAAEQDKGYFFVICEINNADTDYINRMQQIVDEIENNYYEIPDEENQTALEIVLNKINEENISMVQPDIPLHCIVGVIRDNEIIFSFYGRPQMMLFYRTKDGSYKKMDLVQANKNEEADENSQLFGQIVQGKIGPNDYLFAGTPNIADYFNHDRLQKIVTSRLPRQSAEHLQRVLAELRSSLSFGGIIINVQKNTEAVISTPKISPIKKGSSAKSLKNLFGTEKSTADLLSPSFLPKFQEKIQNALTDEEPEMMGADQTTVRANTEITAAHLRARQEKQRLPKAGQPADWQESVKNILTFIWRLLKYIGQGLFLLILLIGKFFAAFGRNAMLLFFAITNYQNRRRNILNLWNNGWQNFKNNIKNLPTITKVLFIGVILLVLTFTAGIWYVRAKQAKQARNQAFTSAVTSIKSKQETAAGFLIYGDTEGALAKLNESQEILKGLTCESTQEKAICQDLNKQIQDLLMKTRKITLAKPQLLTDWSAVIPGNVVTHTFLLNNTIYGFGSTDARIASFDLLTKEAKLITPPIEVGNFRDVSVPKENDYALFLYGDKNVAQFVPQENSWKKIDISFPSTNVKISNAIVYNRRVYTVDTENNQIYKHDTISGGFSQGKSWLQGPADLKSAVDMAIDGDLFVLSQHGTINKFTKGQLQNFSISKIDPPLTSADKIWTYNDLKYIYILDSAGKRIIILDKLGQIKNQITATEFIHPTGMIVDETKNIAYILDSNKLYQISLQ